MNRNTNINISNKAKKFLIKRKEIYRINYKKQIKDILVHYHLMPVEELANIVINNYHDAINTSENKVTILSKEIEEELIHLLKVHQALLTKIPTLNFNEFLFIIFDHYLLDSSNNPSYPLSPT